MSYRVNMPAIREDEEDGPRQRTIPADVQSKEFENVLALYIHGKYRIDQW